MATYTPNVPVSGQSLGNSKPTINSNFQAIEQLIKVNHQNFGLTSQGYHTFVDMISQGTTPANPPTGSIAHYSNTVSGNAEWFFQRENSGSQIQMSTVNGTPVLAANGQTFLPGGLVMRFGNQAITLNATSTTITFVNPFTTLYSLNVTVTGAFNPQIWKINDADYSASSFKVSYSQNYNSTGHVFWTAIGV